MTTASLHDVLAGADFLAPMALQAPLACHPLLAHRISAGFPSPAADYVERGLDLNQFLVTHKESSYFFRVAGDSMMDIGIMDGDIVLVDRSVAAQHRHIVLAVLDGEYLLKRLHMCGNACELHAENARYAPIRLAEGQELQIWGVVSAVVRKMAV